MGIATRLAYRAGATAKLAFYAGHYAVARRQSGPFYPPGFVPRASAKPTPDLKGLQRAFFDSFEQDLANIEAGLYLPPEPRHQLRQTRLSPNYLKDLKALDERRLARKPTQIKESAKTDAFPSYYTQNFHWQSDGWLSDESAELYDFQVETIFTGSASAMRRSTALALLAESLQGQDQRSLQAVEIACGTGQLSSEIARNFPRLNLLAMDMSPFYVARASRTLRSRPKAHAIVGAAEALPIPEASVDRIVCVYLFHELPPKVRLQVVAEMARVTRKGGVVVLADSLQDGDDPNLDRLLEAFPSGFHEPYYGSWLSLDVGALFAEAGFKLVGDKRAFLTKAWAFERV
jgi:ubiquinone/menaquinone biosynthesis C-methylase UbiE